MNKLLNYLPPYLQAYRELQGITEAEIVEVDSIDEAIKLLMSEQFIASLDEYGCSRWEFITNLPIIESDDLEIRRIRILNKLLSDIPYTERTLRALLNTLCDGMYQLKMYYNDYRIQIFIEVERLEKQDIVIQSVKNIIPANLGLEVFLNFRTHGWLKDKKLKHQDLKAYTHNGIRIIIL